MKTLVIYIVITISGLVFSDLKAQTDTIPATREKQSIQNIEYFEKEKEKIISEEKEQLKYTIQGINNRLERDMISAEKANALKNEAAEKHARNIENRIAILENKIALEERNREFESRISIFDAGKVLHISMNNNATERKYDKRTKSDLVLAVGFNNALTPDSSIDDLDFKLAGSRFFEIGWAWKTRVFDNSNFLRLKYGVSFQFNGLKPTDNRYFVTEDGLTTLEQFPIELDKSKFRMDNLVFPLHFEFGPSKKIERKDYIRYSTDQMIKIGIGGYAGFNIGERQKLKYREDGDKVKEKLKGDYNTNDFIYGVSGYLSLGSTALYVKYDLNPIFKDPNVELRNLSVGLRFDVD
ncbi:MAG TPA: hypothetical protein VK941_03360 [Gillisia sp.]|nr:hypothetical protein [Gillisia sp.]